MLEPMVLSDAQNKHKKYDALLPRVEALISKNNNATTILQAVLKELHKQLGVNWIGFYQIGAHAFTLGPHYGEGECNHIPLDEGACGLAYQEERSVVVDDVEQFAGHIPCEKDCKSEIVLPLFKQGEVVLLFNAKSNEMEYFTSADEKNLSIVMNLLETVI